MDRNHLHATSLLPAYSLEMTAKDLPALESATAVIPPKTIIAVAFLHSERIEQRIITAKRIHELGFTPRPHIAARRVSSEQKLSDFLVKVGNEGGVRQIFVIAGDASTPLGPYSDSLALIRSGLLETHGIHTVGIAGYPEGHPDISEAVLWRSLVDKVAALHASNLNCEIVTQFGFDPEPVLTWLTRLRREGINVPVRIGLPGPAKISALLRFAARCGVGASAKVLSKYGISMTRLIGSAGPDQLLDALSAEHSLDLHGKVYVHLYSFGGLQQTADWAAAYTGGPEAHLPNTLSSRA